MPTVPNTPTIINIAIISQYLAIRDIRSKNFNTNQVPYKHISQLIRSVRKSVQWAYGYNSSDPTLIATGEYLYSLCAPYSQAALNILANINASIATITGPSNDSILVGQTASFTISVTSSTSYTIQWYRNGILIIGANALTYSFSNAQLTDSGSTFYAKVTNSAGIATSQTGALTVTTALMGSWYAGATDYSAQLEAGTDTVAYNGTLPITDGQPLLVPFPVGQNDFIVVKYPISQSVKVHYANPVSGVDQGPVPGLALNVNTFGGNNYIFSRNGSPFGINNTTGQVQFS